MENKHCEGEKRHGYMGPMEVLGLYKLKNFGWSKFPLAVLISDLSFVCMNSLWLLSCSTQVSPYKIIFIYIYMCSLFVKIQW